MTNQHENCNTSGILSGSIGKHDWAIGLPSEDGHAVFVDDRQLSYRLSPEAAVTLACDIIRRIIADGDYRLNDRPAGFIPPKIGIPGIEGDVQVVEVAALDDGYAAQFSRPWLCQHEDGRVVECTSEDAACLYQRAHRISNGLHPMDGTPIEPVPAL